MSVRWVPQAPDDAFVCYGVHHRFCGSLAQLQVCLHGYMAGIASCHATPLQDLHSIDALGESKMLLALYFTSILR
jgi:hypothetical protein